MCLLKGFRRGRARAAPGRRRSRIPEPAWARAGVTRSDSGGRSPSARSGRVRRATGPAVRPPSGGSDRGSGGRATRPPRASVDFSAQETPCGGSSFAVGRRRLGMPGHGEIFHNIPYARLLRSLRHPTRTPRFRKRTLFPRDSKRCSDRSEAKRRATASPKNSRGYDAGYLKMLSRGRSKRRSRAGTRTAVPLPDPLLRS